ncbi:glycosyl hydrolase family 28-related protein [Pseudobutyrivibrio xylanivorans]|uniref:Polygalacturonase n=1 Tax=Pseudobutyrivibrio xylanivorans DSM 14809 TaxID=1123012 RepID=A0A1M6LK37_PSEXY|nr:glycosyl hydrolase family 28-related protein [Pseudobutyrivibrio xylanivorans]SHJ71551.1 Polygalacturonase [Pseudobutyrivibrio xylanivorans DSM 14809]
MGLRYYFTNKKILSLLLISLLLCFCFFVIYLSFHSRIDDNKVPLASANAEAMFYVENSSGGATCIGDGIINPAEEVSNNSSVATERVLSAPDYSAIIGKDLTIIWHTIKYVDNEYQVTGILAPATAKKVIISTFAGLENASYSDGTIISTKGFYSEYDGGAADYTVSATPSPLKIPNISVPLANGLYANLDYTDSINIRQIGARGDGTSDDYEYINPVTLAGVNLYIPNGTYFCSTRFLFNNDIVIKGESRSNAVLLFRDNVDPASYEKWNQRGLITFNSNNIVLENVGFKYVADITSKFTRTKTQTGAEAAEGVLFSILRADSINIDNCEFYVGGTANPSVSCLWLKSELKDIKNVKITKTNFINEAESTVGGCLWISGHDNANITVSNINVSDCYFFKNNNDEAFSIWGYNMRDVVVQNNRFEFNGPVVQNDVLVAFGMPDSKRQESLRNIVFKNNNISIHGLSASAIKAQLLTDNSEIEISNNTINCTLTNKGTFSCFGFSKAGTVTVANNKINVSGGGEISYMTYGSGIIKDSDNTFTTQNCSRSMLIKSTNSKYFEGANVQLTKDEFKFAGTNTVSELAVIQYPASGILKLDTCTFDTSSSAIHELRYQMLYNSANEYSPNSIEMINCALDGNLIFRLSKYSETDLDLSDSSFTAISFMTPNNTQCLSNLDLSGTKYDKLRMNYKAINHSSLNDICETLTHD